MSSKKVLVTVSGSSPAVERFFSKLAKVHGAQGDPSAIQALLTAVDRRQWVKGAAQIVINHRQSHELAARLVVLAKKAGFSGTAEPAEGKALSAPGNYLFASLTPKQYQALGRFVDGAGRNWRSMLHKAWESGRYPTQSVIDSPVLDSIRNRHGIAWLDKVDPADLHQAEDPVTAAYEGNRRRQTRSDAAHARADALPGAYIRAIQQLFGNGDLDIELYEAALYAVEADTAVAHLHLDGQPWLKGDSQTIPVLYFNLTGRNFTTGDGWQNHQEYLNEVEPYFGNVVGRTVAMVTDKGHTLMEEKIGVVSVPAKDISAVGPVAGL
ncbi:MAG: hypothetical protein CVV05_00935 [Gammaproteobacteria bacterium HGW-Gammaproteobacteria-1]|jgi:hypothetical protein|nr:MAG: hypothetical protein CVV05_00935 [Gammaproteobacteria bacterium HGW-Gammaproteobacteria-1]